MIDDDDLIPIRHPPNPATPWGRIKGRDRRRYARLWGIDLDLEFDGYSGQADFDLSFKMMFCDDAEAEGIGRPEHRTIDPEKFAAAWRPPTMSEMIEEEIARRRAEAAKPMLQ